MFKPKVNIMLDKFACMPVRAHETDAGMDLLAPEDVTIQPGVAAVIDTGVHIQIPAGYYGKLESKSGLNVKFGVVSKGGVIDAGYTGSIKAKLYNNGTNPYTFRAGDKIVQLLIIPCMIPELVEVTGFPDTDRGASGFGSSGR